MSKNLITVIMPALNEAPFIEGAVAIIPKDEFKAMGFDTEVLVVDNGSTDGTGDLALKAGARVLVEPKRGYGYAYLKGFKEAAGDIICTLDADQTYPAQMLPSLIKKMLDEDLDFITTNRFTPMLNGSMSKRNRFGNVVLTATSRTLFGTPFRDSQSGMWVMRGDLLRRLKLRSGGMALSEEIKIEAWRKKARCAEVPVTYRHRNGTSKLRVWRDGLGNLLHLARLRLT